MTWKDRAACRTFPDRLFVTLNRGTTYKQGKAICDQCYVQADCLDYAVNMGINYGLWGGQSPEERRAVRMSNLERNTA